MKRSLRAVVALAAASSLVSFVTIACSSSEDSVPLAPADSAPESAPEEEAASAEDASDGGASCALPATYGSLECNACMATNCCLVITTCEGDPGCKSLGKCVTDCLQLPDAGGCRKDCLSAMPEAAAPWGTVESCWFGDQLFHGCLQQCT